MQVVALLSWYDEQPEHLARCVESVGRAGADRLVAVDGPYFLYPHTDVCSPSDQHEALRAVAAEWSLDLTIHIPAFAWGGNEVEKRSALFSLGHAVATPADDWLWVIDADETAHATGDWRRQLEVTDRHVASILEAENGTPKRLERRLFRAHPAGIEVRGAHFLYRDGDGRALWGPDQIASYQIDLEIVHSPRQRSSERLAARDTYYDWRTQHNIEPVA